MVNFANGIHFNEFKNLISNSYRNYCYDISFTDAGGENQLFDDIIENYLIKNAKNLSLLCKSVGKLEAEVLDQKIEMAGRNIITAGKFNYKSPIVLQFYDVVLGNDANGRPFMTSDLFKHWIERWNLEHPVNTYEKLYTRRRYLEENSLRMNIKLYRGMYLNASSPNKDIMDLINKQNGSDESFQQKLFDRIKRALSENKLASTSIDRWEYFWDEDDIARWGGFEFMKSMNGVGGSGITLHGLINAYVFTFIKALTISELFVNLANDINSNAFEESAADYALKQAGDLAGFDIYHEKPAMKSGDVINSDADRGNQPNTPKDLFESESFIRDIQSYMSSRSLDAGLLEQLNTLKSNPSFGAIQNDIINAIDKTKFENPEQKRVLSDILNIIMGGNINQSVAKDFGDLVDKFNDYVSNDSLLEIRKQLIRKLEMNDTSSFINESSVNIIKDIIGSIDNIMSMNINDSFINEQRKIEIENLINKILSAENITDDIINKTNLEVFLKSTSFDRGSIGWHLKSRNYFASLFLPATAFVRAIQAKDNLKSFFNFMMPNNGWDDFLNSELMLPGVAESSFMRNADGIKRMMKLGTLTLEELIDFKVLSNGSSDPFQTSGQNESQWDYDGIPGEYYDKNLSNSYMKENRDSKGAFINASGQSKPFSSNDATSPIRQFTLTNCYPTNVNIQPEVSNDKIGAESIPVIDVSFNFFKIQHVN